MNEPKPIDDEHLPKATHEGVWKLGDLELRVYHLDDGRAVIHAEDFEKALRWMGIDPSLDLSR